MPKSIFPHLELLFAHTGQTSFTQHHWSEHRFPYWVLDLITVGHQQQHLASAPPFTRHSGILALYPPHTRYYELQEPNLHINEAYAGFIAHGPIARQLKLLLSSQRVCYIHDPQSIASTPLQKLGALFPSRGSNSEFLTTGLLLETLGYLFTASTPTNIPTHRTMAIQQDSDRSLISQVHEYLQKHLDEPVTVADLARTTGLSLSAFAHTYPKIAHETPYQTIMNSKINAAKRLLLRHGLSVQQTAQRLGFSSEFNFSRTFKRLEGLAPSYYVAKFTNSPTK